MGGSAITIVSPIDGYLVCEGSLALRNNSNLINDMTAHFRLNGVQVSSSNTYRFADARAISTNGPSLSCSSMLAVIPVTKGTSYNLTVWARASQNGSEAADGSGHATYSFTESVG